ncbi:hypothetical protein GGS21DRAFT_85376 [Xylaria nigripes]|nr:hypothetical protein GGS21DRAFT_85376 [Xylaria nigripes]
MAPGLGNQAIDTPDPTSPIPATPPAQPEPTPAPEAGKLRKRKHSHKHKGKKLNRFTCTYATSMIEWLTHFNTPKWLPSSGTITGSINMFITTTALSTTETGYFLGGQALMPQNNLHGQPGKLGEQEVNAESSDDEYEDDEDEDECGDVGEAENVTETATVTVTITTIATILETSTVTETETEGKPSEAN